MSRIIYLFTSSFLFCLIRIGQAQEISIFPYFEGFENADFENVWTVETIFFDSDTRFLYQSNDRNTPGWLRDDDDYANGRGSATGYSSQYFLRVNHNSITREQLNGYHSVVLEPYPTLITPTFQFADIASANLTFRYHMWQGSQQLSWLRVEVMINNNGDYVEVYYDDANHYDVWWPAVVPLEGYLNQADVTTKLKFRITSYNPHDYNAQRNSIAIDAFEIKDIVYKDQPVTDATNWIEVDTTGIALTNRHMAVMSNTVDPNHELWVNGSLKAKEVLISVDSVPDYVFKEDYDLWELDKVRAFINEYHHLPGVPSEAEYKADGVDLGDLNMLLLQKIEELTLHVIDLKEEVDQLKSADQTSSIQK